MVIDQLLFGYQDGHRQIAGSRHLNRDASSVLLGATDAAVSGDHALLTGLPLVSEETYALSVTWSAPEIDRPGAVWAHTLLVDFDTLSALADPASLFNYVRRPHMSNFDSYTTQVSIDAQFIQPISADPSLVGRILEAGTAAQKGALLLYADLEAAGRALLVLWSAQWPELRRVFSFRTRETTRGSTNPHQLVVARRVRGMSRPPSRTLQPKDSDKDFSSSWLQRLARPSLGGSRLREFLARFGPDEPADLDSLVFLGRVSDGVEHEDLDAVLQRLKTERPRQRDAPTLKRALFGPDAGSSWSLPEVRLIEAVLRTRVSMFDPRSLELHPRLEELIRHGETKRLVKARARTGPRPIRKALLDALILGSTSETYVLVALSDRELASDLLKQRQDFLEDREFWQSLNSSQAEEVIDQHRLSGEMVTAAARGGQMQVLVNQLPFVQLAEHFFRAGHLNLVVQALRTLPKGPTTNHDQGSRSILLLAAAEVPPKRRSVLLEALEEARGDVDEVWLRSAVFALKSAKSGDVKPILCVVFGPLDRALATGPLPRGASLALDSVLPSGKDRRRRLRRLLVHSLENERWSARELAQALRDSNTAIGELGRDVAKDEDLANLVKSAFKLSGNAVREQR
jgi:hypothetical protein